MGTLTPLIPLSLRAFKGEGEEKTEAYARTRVRAYASSLILVGGEDGIGWAGMTGET